jgi:hypothetical protein
MNFLGGSLPNVMFLIGVLAIGLGLGIELKLVPLSKEIDKTGRIGAMVVGAILVAASLYIYLNPALMSPNQPAPATANGALAPVQAAPSTNTQLIAAAPTVVPPSVPTAASLPPPRRCRVKRRPSCVGCAECGASTYGNADSNRRAADADPTCDST